MELAKSNHGVSPGEAESHTEASLNWDTDALPAPSLDSNVGAVSAAGQQDCAPRRLPPTPDGVLYIHTSSLLSWHQVLGQNVRLHSPGCRHCCFSDSQRISAATDVTHYLKRMSSLLHRHASTRPWSELHD